MKYIITLIYIITLTGCTTVMVDCRGLDPAECQQRQYAEQAANVGIAATVGALIGYALGRAMAGGERRPSRSHRRYHNRDR